jgi:hypothetical protein
MNTRPDKPKEYFAKLLDTPEEKIDYSQIPATTVADWKHAEILLPVTAEEFRAIKPFILRRREEGAGAADSPTDQPTSG